MSTFKLSLTPEIDVSTQLECFSVEGLPDGFECYIKRVDGDEQQWLYSIDGPGTYHVSDESYDSPTEALAGVEGFLIEAR